MGQIDELAQRNPAAAADELLWLTRLVACGLGLGTVVIGAWVWWLGHRLRQTGYFPAPEVDVMHPTRWQSSTDPANLGRAAQAVGVIVIFLGIAAAWLMSQLAQMLLNQ
jgi:hypothetical protein